MTILINTDKNISGNERFESYVHSTINEDLSRIGDNITRIEVHFSDENGNKEGVGDKRCTLEARLKKQAANCHYQSCRYLRKSAK